MVCADLAGGLALGDVGQLRLQRLAIERVPWTQILSFTQPSKCLMSADAETLFEYFFQ